MEGVWLVLPLSPAPARNRSRHVDRNAKAASPPPAAAATDAPRRDANSDTARRTRVTRSHGRAVVQPRARKELHAKRTVANRYLRPTATNTARSTSCPAQPPPLWRQRPPSTFSITLSVHGLWARFSIACGAFHGAFLSCGSPAPEPLAPPPTTCCGLFLRHDVGSAALVALYVIMICMRFPSRRRCGNRRTNLLCL